MKSLKPCLGRRFLIHCRWAAWLALLAGTAASRGQTVQFNAQGLSGFNVGASNLLRDTELRLQHLARAQNPAEPGGDFDVVATHYDATQHRREQTYRWGSLACVYSPVANGLDLALTVHNAGARPIQAIFFDVLQLHFPSEPAGVPWHDHWTILRGGTNSEEPPVIVARWDNGSLALFNEGVPADMVFGFRPEFSTSNQVVVLRRSTPLAAGESVNCRLQLRTGSGNASLRDLAGPAVDAFLQKHPPELTWKDHRAIATIFFATSVAGYAHNPRGWLLDPTMDVTTSPGRAGFAAAMLRVTDESIRNAKRLNAQGLIIWDVEGQEMRHPISYLGDPRVLPQAAPEMDAIADGIFARVRAAGLRTGVTIRPTRPVRPGGGTNGWEQMVVPDPASEMQSKIDYARRRWGCTLFYADSNVEDRQIDGRTETRTMPARVFERLARQNPDVLIMPEHAEVQYWATHRAVQGISARLHRHAGRGARGVSGCLHSVEGGGWAAVGSALGGAETRGGRGDILLFRAWWSDPVNDQVKRLYEEASVPVGK